MSYKPLFCHNCLGDLREVDGGWECKVCGVCIDREGRHYLPGVRQPTTIGDQIRAMFATDEGIAKILLALDISLVEDGREFTHLYCDGKNNCITEDDNIVCTDEMRTACILRWLQQPAEQAPTATVAEYEKQHSGLIDEED